MKKNESDKIIVNAKTAGVEKYPLMSMERGMYLEQKLNPESVALNLKPGFIIEGATKEAICEAVHEIFLAHEALHSFYEESDGTPYRILTQDIPEIAMGDEMSYESFVAMLNEFGEPFCLEDTVPARLALYPIKESGFGLYLQMHHIAFDRMSIQIFAKELFMRLRGQAVQDASDIYALCIDSTKQKDIEEKVDDAWQFFDKMFEDGVPVNEPPLKSARPKGNPLTDMVLNTVLGGEKFAMLSQKAKQVGATLFEIVASVYAAVICQYCGSEDVVLNVPVNMRDELSKDMIGMFVNSVPIRIRPKREMLYAEYISEISDTVRKATRSYNQPFEAMVKRYCKGAAKESVNPLFAMGLNYVRVPDKIQDDKLSLEMFAGLQAMNRDIAMEVRRGKDFLEFNLRYSSELFEADIMENFLEQLQSGFDRIEKGEVVYVKDLVRLPERQLAQLESFSQSKRRELKQTLVHKMFEETALRNADRLAVIACDRSLTFDELNCQANRIAWKLMELGVKCGDNIILLLPRRSFYFSAAIGVLKAGASFIPCDPAYPTERVVNIATDASSSFIITTKERMSEYADNNAIDIDMLIEGGRDENPCVQVTGEDLAYMIYTSGSTGKPKGVLIKHIGVCNYFEAEEANVFYHQVKSSNAERILCITTVSFDMSMKESFGMIVNGKTIVFADEDKMNDPISLSELIERYDIDILSGTPSRIQQYMEYEPFAKLVKRMKIVVCGGEAYPTAFKDMLAEYTDAVLVNTYGPTEITISSNMAILSKDKPVTIGRPILNVREYILDVAGNPVPRGVVGELYIGGPGVARGYNNLEQQTREHFVDFKGERFYRSGDYAKWDACGNVYVLGRMDNQVKLHGLRIELGEIEGLLEKQPGIHKAIVAIRKIDTQEQLCAWYVSDKDIDITLLKNELRKKLTAYMIPAVFTRIAEIPVLASGKINMKALPEPKFAQESVTKPKNEIQQQIFDIVAEVIGNANFGIETELFAVGLTSINSIRLSIRLTDAFSVNVSVRDFRENDTIERLEKFILSLNEDEKIEVCDEYAITKIQEGIFFETQTHKDTTIYNIPSLIELDDSIELGRLKHAIAEAVSAHPYLDVRFFLDEQGRIRQKRNDEQDVFSENDILTDICGSIDEIKNDLVQPYDLLKDRLFRVRIIETKQKNYLFFEAHHMIFDGQSKSIMMRDISRAYAGDSLQAEIYSGYEASLVEEQLRSSAHYDKSRKYYSDLFADVEQDCLPIPDEQDVSVTGTANVTVEGDASYVEAVMEFCKKKSISENAFYTAVFGYVLAKFCAREDAVFATVNNGRNDSRFADSVAMFVRTFPVLCKLDNVTVLEYINAVSRQLMDSQTFDAYAFEEMKRELGITADILFVYQGQFAADAGMFCGLPCERISVELDEVKSEIEFAVYPKEGGSGITYHCGYRKSSYTEEFIKNFIQIYEQALSEFSKKEKLADIDLLSSKQKDILDEFNCTEAAYDTDKTIVDLFRESVSRVPNNTAVIFKDRTYTYREVDRISDNIALFLMSKGIGREDVVSVLIERSEYMPIVSLGVVKAGAAYQPLDPTYPDERLAFMIQDSAAKLLIADEALAGRISVRDIDILITKDIMSLPDVKSDEKERLLAAAPKPEDLFILLYTSGSTGTPKGAMLEHRNIAAFCNQHCKKVSLGENSCVSAYASYGFDACMMDMYPTLAVGARLVVIPEDIRLDLLKINEVLKEQKVTHSFFTTQVGRQFAQICDSKYLKHLLVGGEALVPIEAPVDFTLYNGYGPTECTIFTTIQPVKKLYRRTPIGKPIDNMKIYVMDKNMHRLPIGVPGELCVSGAQVARGYKNSPDKTKEVFVGNLFDSKPGYEYIYRTGDIVRLLNDGTVDFVGRKDSQVKIRGFRIELSEVEEVIRRFEGIEDATVVAFDASSGGKELAAYIVSADTIDIRALQDFIRKEKPDYMVPAAIMQIDAIPLNVNQKVDKKSLPVPVINDLQSEDNVIDIPLNALETEIRQIAAEVLGTENFSIVQKLSHLGLTSISAIRLATMIYKKYGVSLNVTELISAGTIQTIENAILLEWMNGKADLTAANDNNIKEKEAVDLSKKIRLSFSQQGVYAECMAATDSTLYNTPFCVGFPSGVSVDELKAAVYKVVSAHPAFSIRFTYNSDNDTVQYLVPNYEPEIQVTKMSQEEFAKYRTEFVRPFVLNDEPLSRFEIIVSDDLYLLMDIHHLITDGASIDIFLRQLCDCMNGEMILQEEYTYFDYVTDEEITSETEQFLDGIMSDFEEATRLIPDVYEEGREHVKKRVSVRTNLKDVADFASRSGVTPAAVYLAAEYIAASRYVCEDSVAITTISGGRSNMRIYNTMGMFVNTLPLAVKIDNEEETIAFLRRIADNYSATIAHEHYPFAKVVQRFDFHPSLSYTYQVGVLDEYSVHGKAISVEGMSIKEAKLPCSVYITGSAEKGGEIQVEYDEALYSECMMLNFAKSIDNVVCAMMNKKTLKEIGLTTEEQWKVLDTYNRPFDLDYDHTDTAVSLFRKQAADKPDKVAAVYKDKEYTFSALDELTDRLAEIIYSDMHDITGLDNLAEQVIPIISSRNEFAFILPLAVLKTGCAYEPLDPDYPNDRLNFMVKDSGAKLLIAERGLEESVNEFDGTILYIDELCETLNNGYNPAKLALDIPAPKPENLLIMLYTSGTTGVPKGVQLIHENLVAFAHGSALDGLYTGESKTATYASFGFDVNMADTFCTILNGGTIYLIAEDERMNLDALAAYFDEAGITDVLLTTQVGVQFINSFPRLKSLRMLTVGGEKLPAISTDALSYDVYNGYGPTENCAGVSIFKVKEWEPNIPIGKPFPSINAFVLDKTGHRLPSGAAGEYCLSGPQVGRGYLNRPDKTAEAFEKCPFNDFRMYHTGDIVRYRENGDVEFVGRKDGQVKIRGFRVELKEIEAVIREFDGIDDVTVQAYDFAGGGKYLAAFVVASKKIDEKSLCEFIKEQKPAYMVPSAIMQIDEIPLTVNQKVDKKSLPKPELKKGEYAAPKTEAEENFCRIFGEILGIEKVGAEDDFFELGGSSITAMKVVLAAGKVGYGIVYQDVFDNSTPRLLAALTEDGNSEQSTLKEEKASNSVSLSSTYIGRDGYDYTAINEMLKRNNLDTFRVGKCRELGDVLLTGSTGFLGIHVLHELINTSNNRIYCLSRSRNGVSGSERLAKQLKAYFDKDFTELFGNRIVVIDGDGIEKDTLKDFAPDGTITVINCAANVAHFSKDDAIWTTNVNLVKNLISWCLEHGSNLVHVSTGSVSGATVDGVPGDSFKLSERILYGGQLVENNQYIHSKFMAERLVYEAILEKGLHAKVMRVSNLAPRFTDGMPQVNYETNSFLNSLRAYYSLGKISYKMMSTVTELSPIDYVAKAVLALAKTPQECTCFNLANEYMPKMGDVLLCLSSLGREMKLVEPEELSAAIQNALQEPGKAELISPLLTYAKSKKEGDVRTYGFDVLDSDYTMQVLYRLGFRWPLTDGAYVERFAARLKEIEFF